MYGKLHQTAEEKKRGIDVNILLLCLSYFPHSVTSFSYHPSSLLFLLLVTINLHLRTEICSCLRLLGEFLR